MGSSDAYAMTVKAPPFRLSFEILFLESYERLNAAERRAVDKAVAFLMRKN